MARMSWSCMTPGQPPARGIVPRNLNRATLFCPRGPSAGGSAVTFRSALALLVSLSLAGCGDSSKLPEQVSLGPSPTLPQPTETLIPTVHIAPAKGWPEGDMPIAASDLRVVAYARGFEHPRWLYVLPNGDVLVAESNA